MGLFKVYIEAAKIGNEYTLLFTAPMFSVYLDADNSTETLAKVTPLVDKLKQSCARARMYLTKDMQLPQMHINIVLKEYGTVRYGNQLFAAPGYAHRYKQHVTLSLNAVTNYSIEQLTELIVHESLHLYTFNKSKEFKRYITQDVYPKAIWGMDVTPGKAFKNKLALIIKHDQIVSDNNTYSSEDLFYKLFEPGSSDDYAFWFTYFKQETKELYNRAIQALRSLNPSNKTQFVYLLRQELSKRLDGAYIKLTQALDSGTSKLTLDYGLGDLYVHRKDLETPYTAISPDEYITTLGNSNAPERRQAVKQASKILQTIR